VYRMNVSAAAVARHDHVPLAEAMAENYGDFTLVVRDGRFAFTQRNPNAGTWQYGRLRVNGDRMDWFFTDGGGRGPNNAANKPGEHFIWKATLYRGALTMRPVTPADLMGQAWHRVGAAPTIRALAAACRPPVTALPR